MENTTWKHGTLTQEQKNLLEACVLRAAPCNKWIKKEALIRLAANELAKQGKPFNVRFHDYELAIDRLARKGRLNVTVRERGWYRWKVYQYPVPF